jgi:NAD(P)-dependent dehydrogenase (short-subunit alcohol dehydrogenase family)
MNRLQNKVAFITGGSRGMGAAIALRLAQEGANIVFTHSGNHQQKADAVVDQIKKAGSRVREIVARNESSEELIAALDTAVDEFGGIDILVNNAGTYAIGALPDLTLEEFDRIMAVNVRAIFVTSKYAAQHMKEGGRIINIGSNLAERVPGEGMSLYAMSKSALIGLTKGIARDLGSRNIAVNLLQPGSTHTDMNPEDGEYASGQISMMAIRRFARPEEVAGMVAYLASDESQMITGAVLTMDGGFNI